MTDPPDDVLDQADEPRTRERRPYAMLAASVIEMAVRDLDNPNTPGFLRRSASAFLDGGPMLRFWCDRLDLSPETVRARALRRRR